jgi:signal transduction histidine kinase
VTGAVVLGLAVPVTAAQSLVPLLRGAIVPGPVETLVPVALVVVGLVAVVEGRRLLVICCGLAALLWSLVGLAAQLPPGLEVLTLRLAMAPLALLVMALIALPDGTLTSRRKRGLALAALLVAAAVGAGLGLPTLVLMGLIVVAAAVRPSRPDLAMLVQVVLGTALAVLGVVGSMTDPPAWAAADAVGLAMVVGALGLLLGSHRVRTDEGRARASDNASELALNLGAALGTGPVSVAFVRRDSYVDLDGEEVAAAVDGLRVVDPTGEVVAVLDLAPGSDIGIGAALNGLLGDAAALARRRYDERRQARVVEESRRRLVAAGVEERARVEGQLQDRVLARLTRLRGALEDDNLLRRLDDTRKELSRLAAGIDPLHGRGLRPALAAVAAASDRVTAILEVDVEPDPVIASTAWFVASEAVTNALKHGAGSAVEVVAKVREGHLLMTIRDKGPGGVPPGGPVSITDRVRAVGGRLHVTSGPDGTAVEVVLPVAGFPVRRPRAVPDPAGSAALEGSRP